MDLLEAIVESSPDAIMVVGADDRLRLVNEAAARLLGAPAGDLTGRELAPLLGAPPGHAHVHLRGSDGTARTLRRRSREVEVHGEHLRIDTLSELPSPPAPCDHPPYREIVENIAEGVVLVRARDGAIIYVNPTFERLFGYDPGEILGRHISVVNAPGERDPSVVAAEIMRHLHAHGSWRGEVANVDKAGRVFPCQAVVSTYDHPAHGPVWLSIHEEISARKDAEAAIRRASEAALSANRAKTTFLSRMSHEIRTPLNAVIGTTELLADEPLSPRGRDLLRMLRCGGESLFALVNDILELSSLEAGRIASRPEDFEVPRLLEEAVGPLALVGARKGLAVRVVVDPGVPRRARADAVHLRQVLLNLVGNAIKFTRRGAVEVHAAWDGRGRLVLRVVDTGPGIPPSLQAALFDPYRRPSLAIEGEGSGLGLGITRAFVELMGGAIDFDTSGSGTTFTVTLLLAAPLADPSSGDADPLPKSPAAGARILVAEDDLSSALILEAMLRHQGAAEVLLTHDGREALDAWRGADFDIVLLDKQMPALGGLDTAKLLRAEAAASRRPRPKIAIITADAFDEDRRACMEAGCDDFLAKPLTPRGLSELLARLARLRTAEGDDHDDHHHGGDAGPHLDAHPTQIAAST